MKIKKSYLLKFIGLFFLLIMPWYLGGVNNDIVPEKITSDLAFYEINTCKISLTEFLWHNTNVIYQDHYKIRFNNYSSIKCFGTITGIDQINHVFYISIGTNSFINLIYQTFIWLAFFSIFKKISEYNRFEYRRLIPITLASVLQVSLIYVEQRYYLQELYAFDFYKFQYFRFLFIFIFFVCFIANYIVFRRESELINIIPFFMLFIGVFSGFNFHLAELVFVTYGIYYFLNNKRLWINRYYLLFLLFLWFNNSYKKEYYLDVDKFRGFSSIFFSDVSISLYALKILFLINGIIYFYKNYKNRIDVEKITINFCISSILILLFGFMGATNPLANFLNYYFFGQNKFGIDRGNLFQLNEWGERMAWRGFFPSAETIGELFALTIFLLLINKLKINSKFKKQILFFTYFSLIVGLLASNNRAAIIALLLIIFIFYYKNLKIKNNLKYLSVLSLALIFLYLIGFQNLTYSLKYISESLLNDAKIYTLTTKSTSLIFMENSYLENKISSYFISIISIFAFLVNRSELWGIFLARYNPSFQEFLWGSGPLQFGKLYGDIKIDNTSSFLFPHSSFLDILLFFGIINLLILLSIFLYKAYISYKYNLNFMFFISIFIFLNLMKSDSLIYFPSFIIYFFMLLISLDRNFKLINFSKNKLSR